MDDNGKKYELFRKIFPKKLERWKIFLVLFGMIALLLLCLSSIPGKTDRHSKKRTDETLRVDIHDYEQQLEERLSKIISAIDGAGKAQIMVTLESSNAPIYATQGDVKQKNTITGESREENFENKSEYVILGSGNNAQGLILKIAEPQIRGVAVICEGASSLSLQQKIVDLLSALLGIGSNKVSICQMKSQN